MLQTEAGPVISVKFGKFPARRRTMALFVGNDSYPQGYAVVGVEVPKGEEYQQGRKAGQMDEDIYHIVDESSGMYGAEWMDKVLEMCHDNHIERVIIISSDKGLRNTVRKKLGVRVILHDDKPLNYSKVILSEWLGRRTIDGKAVLRIWTKCNEAVSGNYPPARWAITRLLEYFDSKRGKRNYTNELSQTRGGYA